MSIKDLANIYLWLTIASSMANVLLIGRQREPTKPWQALLNVLITLPEIYILWVISH